MIVLPPMSQELGQKFSEALMTPLAIEVQTESSPVPRCSSFSREDHSLTVFAVPLIDQFGVAEGALVLLMRGRVENADLLRTQLDMLAGSVSLRLADLLSVVPDASGPLINETQMTERSPDRQAVVEEGGARSQLTQSDSADAETLRPAELPVPAETTSSSLLREFAYSLVNSLCNQLRAEQVGFGLREGGRIRVLAVSGLAEVKSANPGISMMRQAMKECLDEAHPIVSPTPDSEIGAQTFIIHSRWSSEISGACVASIPITDTQGMIAVVSIRLPPGRAMRSEFVSSISMVLQKQSHSIRLLEKVSRSLTSHLRTAIADKLGQLTGKNSIRQKTAVAFAAGLCLWYLFGTLTYRPICNARITAENLLQMTSGSESKLKVVHVVSGEIRSCHSKKLWKRATESEEPRTVNLTGRVSEAISATLLFLFLPARISFIFASEVQETYLSQDKALVCSARAFERAALPSVSGSSFSLCMTHRTVSPPVDRAMPAQQSSDMIAGRSRKTELPGISTVNSRSSVQGR